MLTTLALDYALLRLVPEDKSIIAQCFSTTLLISAMISTSLIFLRIKFGISLVKLPLRFFIASIFLFILLCISSVLLFSLLGLFKNIEHFLITFAGTLMKFLLTFIMLIMKILNGFTLLLAYIISTFIVLIFSLILIKKENIEIFTLPNIKKVIKIYKIASVNVAIKTIRNLIFYLAPLMLSWLDTTAGSIGCLYTCLVICLALAALPGSVAIVMLPTSVLDKNHNRFKTTIRQCAGLCLLICSILTMCPDLILSIIKPEYIKQSTILTILSWLIFLYSFDFNIISKWNSEDRYKNLIVLGFLQLVAFFTFSILLGTLLGSYGVALAVVFSTLAAVVYEATLERPLIIKPLLIGTLIMSSFTILHFVRLSYRVLLIPIVYPLAIVLLHYSGILMIQELMYMLKVSFQEIKLILRFIKRIFCTKKKN